MEIIQCAICGKEIVKKNGKQKYCSKCSSKVNKENTKKRQKKKER
jgi:uncharacterized Zn finger protein (UPF0148 family)